MSLFVIQEQPTLFRACVAKHETTAISKPTLIPSKIGDNKWPVVAVRVPTPKAAASVKQTMRSIRRGMVGMNLSVNVRNIAPRDANSKTGWWISKPTIIGAMTKTAALSPTVKLKADLSRRLISLENRLPIFMLYHNRLFDL